jgi:hypothetical protein
VRIGRTTASAATLALTTLPCSDSAKRAKVHSAKSASGVVVQQAHHVSDPHELAQIGGERARPAAQRRVKHPADRDAAPELEQPLAGLDGRQVRLAASSVALIAPALVPT